MLTIAATTAFQTVYPWFMQQSVEKQGRNLAFRHVADIMKNSCHGFSQNGEMIKNNWPELSDQNLLDKTI